MRRDAWQRGRQGLGIRGRLALIAAAVLVPYVVGTGYVLYSERAQADGHLRRELAEQAERISERLEQHAARVRDVLGLAGAALADEFERPEQVGARLAELAARVPGVVAWLTLAAPDGRVLASTAGEVPAGVNLADREHFKEALRTGQPHFGRPVVARLTGEWILAAAAPVAGPQGAPRGVLSAVLTLQELDRWLRVWRLRQEFEVRVATERGELFGDTAGAAQSRGRLLEDPAERRAAREGTVALLTRTAEDGGLHYVATAPVRNAPWQVYVSAPASLASSALAGGLRTSLGVAAAMLLASVLAVLVLGRPLVRDVRRLQSDVHALAQGDLARAVAPAAGELGELSGDIAHMAGRLAEARARLESLVRLSSDWYWETDTEGRIVALEGAAAEHLALGQRWTEALRVGAEGDALRSAIAARSAFRDVEFVREGEAGEVVRVYRVSGEPRFDAQGRFLGYRGVASDATEQRRLEAVARRAAEQLRLVVDAVPAMIAYVSRDLHYVYVNAAYRMIFDVPAEAVVGRPVREIAGEEIWRAVEPYFQRAFAGETVSFARRHRRADGTERDLRIHYVPDRDEAGCVRGVVGLVTDVTELEETRRALRAEHDRLLRIVETMAEALLIYDAQGRHVLVNAAAERIFGVRREQLLGRHALDVPWRRVLLGAAERSEPDASFERLRAGEARIGPETCAVDRLDGVRRLVAQYAVRLGDEDGRFTGAMLVAEDVTELRRAEESLRLYLAGSLDGFLLTDAEGRILETNAAMAALLGYSEDELRRLSLADLLAGETPAEFAERMAELRRHGRGRAQVQRRRKDGRLVHLEVSASYLPVDGGRIYAFYRDVTDRVDAERRLAESERRFRSFFELSQDGMAIVRDGVIEEANEALARMVGASRAAALAGTPLLDLVAEEHRENEQARLHWLAIERGQLPFKECRLAPHDGSALEVETAANAIEDGDTVRVHFVARDISTRKTWERQLRDLNAELERRVAARTAELTAAYQEMEAFSYSVSHDLRAPLRAISGFAHIVMEDFRDEMPAEALRLLGRVAKNAERMGTLIDGLLEFGRLSRQVLRRQRVDPAQIVREVIEEFAPQREGRQVKFEIGALPPCWADPVLLKQVYANLIGNALKYTARRPEARIEIGSIRMGLGPVYYVRDNGVGFDMAYASKLFGMFQRLHGAEEFEGNGVGLALVRRIVERHDGEVWADAAPDRGATFFFRLGAETNSSHHEERRVA